MTHDGKNQLIAPSGPFRAVINLGNPILARLENGELAGISVDLAREFARRRGLDIVLRPVDTAARSVAAVGAGDADLGFFAVDPLRGEEVAFTDPYLLIEGWYLVRDESPFTDNASVDRHGVRIAVGKGSAYDLFLSRNITKATLERVPTSPAVVDHFVRNDTDVAAGIRQQLESDMQRHAGLRLLPERFMVIRQAMGVPATRDPAVPHLLNEFLTETRTSGFIAELMERHGIRDALVA